MSQKIYTKTGDTGRTSLIGGTKVPKSHIRINAYGTTDELNAWIGMLGDQLSDMPAREQLREIQDRLFTIGSSLACDPDKEISLKIPDLLESDILLLEKEMDAMNEKLPEMKSFILPGGHSRCFHCTYLPYRLPPGRKDYCRTRYPGTTRSAPDHQIPQPAE